MRKVFSKIGRIFLGWYYWITDRNNETSNVRLKICIPCSDRKGFICGVCLCPLKAKTRVEDEYCPLGKWNFTKYYNDKYGTDYK